MKQINKLLSIILILTLTTSFYNFDHFDDLATNNLKLQISSELNNNNLNNEDPEVHWFYVRVRPSEKLKAYVIIGTASQVETGRKSHFEKALWWGISKGQIAVGPFWSHKEAIDARLFYRKTPRPDLFSKSARKKKEVHWFLITFRDRQRSPAYQLLRMPARLASGNPQNFSDALYEGMTFERFSVGPFTDYSEAEEAKAMYRLNE